ncbi:MAG TPA: metal ABC transporter ATP-binding protein [Verrucomicrobiae bacterium]|nr:metal ABC transporter ATP-binding protein [Verrucomicrobiae bacterium]
MPVMVSVQNVSCRYHATEALCGVSAEVREGDYVGVAGPNGSGKSTLVKTMLGLVRPDDGSVSLFGTPVDSFTEWNRVGYLPQRLRLLLPSFPATVQEVVKLGLLGGRGFPRRFGAGDRARIDRALEALGIGAIRKRMIGELSGGQQQRVLLARAIVSDPQLLVMDEPTTALDPETRERFFTLLDELHRTRGTTVVLVTHDTGSIGKHASRLLYVDKRIIFDGGFDEFCRSQEMTSLFGELSQHTICRMHGNK